MIDSLKFFPFKWRSDHNPTEIRGPYFSRLRGEKWFLGNCTLYFGAPTANPVFGLSGRGRSVGATSPRSANILKAQWQIASFSSDAPLSEWGLGLFYTNTWYFVGPWFTGVQASLTASALLVTADKSHSFADKSLFHPRVFESAVANYLDTAYGYRRMGQKPMYRGPLNWRVLPISTTINAVVCDIHEIGNGCKENPVLHRLVYFPVSPTQFIQMNFDFGGVEINRDEVRAKPLFKLCDEIISTFRLEVGQLTQDKWDKVKVTCPDMSITETMGEFQWPLKKAKKTSKTSELDITPSQRAIEQQSQENP